MRVCKVVQTVYEVSESARGLVLAGCEGRGCSGNQWHQEPPQGGSKQSTLQMFSSEQSGNQCSGKMIIGEEERSERSCGDNNIETKLPLRTRR